MITCEQCGNDFYKGKLVKKDDKEYISCPFCRYLNPMPYKKNKKRRNTARGENR